MRGKRRVAKAAAILVMFLLLIGSAQMVFSEEARAEGEFGNVISVNPMGLFLGGSFAEYERVWKSNMSFVWQAHLSFRDSGRWESTVLGAAGGINRYLNPSAPERLWFGGRWSLEYHSAERGGDEDSSIFVGLRGAAGYKWIFGERFTVEPALVLAILIGSLSIEGRSYPWEGINGEVSLSVGYTF